MFKKVFFFALIFVSLSFAITEEEIKKAYWQSYNFEKMQRYDEAIKSLMPVYTAYPNGYTVNLRLGWLYYLKGNFKNSIFHYNKAVKVYPYSIEAKLGLTLPLLAQKKYDSVKEVCYQILKVDFYNYYANLRLSYALRLSNDLKNAEKVVLKMLYLYPTDVNFLLELSQIRIASDRIIEARKILNDVLILDPLNNKAKELLDSIKGGS